MSGSRQNVIDFLDLELFFQAGFQDLFAEGLRRLEDLHDHVEVVPKLRPGRLLINSTDAVALLGYLAVDSMSEIEQKRIKKLFASALEQALIKTTSLDRQNHYKWCLTAIKRFRLGRFLSDEPA